MDINIVGLDQPDLVFLLGAIAFWVLSYFLFKESCTYSMLVFRNIYFEKRRHQLLEQDDPENKNLSVTERVEGHISKIQNAGILTEWLKDSFHINPVSGKLFVLIMPFILFLVVVHYLWLLNFGGIPSNESARAVLMGLILKPNILSAVMLFSSFMNISMATYKYIMMSVLSYNGKDSQVNVDYIMPRSSQTGIAGATLSLIGLIGSLASIFFLAKYVMELNG
jgi:hypothetical protein